MTSHAPPDPMRLFGDPDLATVNAYVNLLRAAHEDPEREGLVDTPRRAALALAYMTSGYLEDPARLVRTFRDGAEGYDELVIQKDIPVYSLCEHHILPFFGVAHIGYLPKSRVLGLSKFSRVLNVFARRLQVQERLTKQVAEWLYNHLQPAGLGVVLECRHLCMEARGVERMGTVTTTSALYGVIKTEPETRSEFLSLARRSHSI